ncbi:MAG: FkbM family methyltransferase [Terracidiphilus sp.]
MTNFLDILPFYARRGFEAWQHAQERVYKQRWKAFVQEIVKKKPFRCRLRGGPKISIRPKPSHDYYTAKEIFFDRIYDCELDPGSVLRIVDLGGNVGYSCLFWCRKYPNARVLTLEPHPTHCRLLEWHVKKNGYANRVKLVAAAAGVRDGIANLTDEDDGAAIVKDMLAGSIAVRLVDVFQAVPAGPIDLLKMDIEGSEYAILEDPRFEALAARTRCVLLEWHVRGDKGEALCRDRLTSLGFKVGSGRTSDDQCGDLFCGMLYCFRDY